MLLMVKKINSKFKFFYTQCGEWEAVVPAVSAEGACSLSICQAVETYGKSALDSCGIMLAMDVAKEADSQNGDHVSVFQVEQFKEELNEY